MQLEKRIISSNISIISFSDLIKKSVSGIQGYICFTNVHMVIEAHQDADFQNIVNNASFAAADGVPVQKALKLLYGIDQGRIAGMDFMPSLIEAAAKEKVTVFFYGGNEATLDAIDKKAKSENPNLVIAGMISPPFRELHPSEQHQFIKTINDSGAKIVFVGLGCPKQEKWMAENTEKIDAVLLGVGAAFETYAETKSMAPKLMRVSGLEWLYRLVQDPKRLWKRYLITNSLFLFLFLKQLIWIKVLGRGD